MTNLNEKPLSAAAVGASSAAYRKIKVNRLTPVIGAEIEGVDIAAGVNEDVLEEIHQAFTENLVIFFRGQSLTLEQRGSTRTGPTCGRKA